MFAALAASRWSSPSPTPPLAAKSRRAGLILIPVLDILQSVPILGFLTFTVVFFMGLFPGSVLGAELAAIFAIFTSQAWNMAFSFYQSLQDRAGRPRRGGAQLPALRLAALLAPRGAVRHARPGLEHDDVACPAAGSSSSPSEAITVGDTTGSCPASAPTSRSPSSSATSGRSFWAILAMLIVILAYDQLLFRPLVAWSAKFRFETTAGATAEDPGC